MSISTVLVWMIINSTLGVMWNYGFIDGGVTIGNIIFYIWFVASLIGLIYFLLRLWKEPIEDLLDKH